MKIAREHLSITDICPKPGGTQQRIPVSKMTDAQIAARLERDGYDRMIGREAEIRRASANGTLLWTPEHLVNVASDGGFDLRPDR